MAGENAEIHVFIVEDGQTNAHFWMGRPELGRPKLWFDDGETRPDRATSVVRSGLMVAAMAVTGADLVMSPGDVPGMFVPPADSPAWDLIPISKRLEEVHGR